MITEAYVQWWKEEFPRAKHFHEFLEKYDHDQMLFGTDYWNGALEAAIKIIRTYDNSILGDLLTSRLKGEMIHHEKRQPD